MEGQFLAHGGEFPSSLVPFLVTTAPPFDSCPFHPFPTPQPTLHYLQQHDNINNHGLLCLGQLGNWPVSILGVIIPFKVTEISYNFQIMSESTTDDKYNGILYCTPSVMIHRGVETPIDEYTEESLV